MPLANLRLGSSSSAPPTPSFPIPLPLPLPIPIPPASSHSSHPPQHQHPHQHSAIELELDSSELVFRAFAGDEANGDSATLSGSLRVHLAESTSLKHISLLLRVVARLDFLEPLSGKRYHQDHHLFTHTSHFLPLCSDSTHTHTLQAGLHTFPFTLRLPAGLPASIRTQSGSGYIFYKLKAVASRTGFLTSRTGKLECKTFLRVFRSFPVDAVEWTQTVDIENTWPGKISYEISLARKAFAAGETIPITIKFTPLLKGVRVTSLVTTIKEHVTILSKPGNAPHVENRDVAEYRFEFKGSGGPSEPLSRASEPATSASATASAGPSAGPSAGTGTGTGARAGQSGGALTTTDLRLLTRRLQAVSVGSVGPPRSRAASVGTSVADGEESVSGELARTLAICLPSGTTPSHPLAPITVGHKLRFSAFISNPDGHTSELRCALPLFVLAPELAHETAAVATGGAALTFGPAGTLVGGAADGAAELPSYPEHVRDRLAPLASAAGRAALVPAPWSLATTPAGSPLGSPQAFRRESVSQGYFPAVSRWSDRELVRSLEPGPGTETDTTSRGRSSHTSSRASSRGSSPNAGGHSSSHSHSHSQSSHVHTNGKYPLRLPKALTRMAQQLTTSSTTSTTAGVSGNGRSGGGSITVGHGPAGSQGQSVQTNGNRPPPIVLVDRYHQEQQQHHQQQQQQQQGELEEAVAQEELESEEVLSRVPSYSVASLGSLGGGPVPISSLIGLPAYEDSV